MKEKNQIEKIPTIKINPNSIIVYDELQGFFTSKDRKIYIDSTHYFIPESSKKNLENNNHNGFLSEKATSRLKNSIKYLFWLSGVFKIEKKTIKTQAYKKVSLLTLTLASQQRHTDNYIKEKMLNQFLIELKKYNKNLLYVWRAEKQENGNIHFHILINIFIPLNLLYSIWNRIQNKEGYIQPYTEKHQNLSFIDYCKLYPPKTPAQVTQRRKAYIKGQQNNWKAPNSIDIHSLKDVKKSYAYCCKYISKNEIETDEAQLSSGIITEEQFKYKKWIKSISGRIWYACEKISKLFADSHIIGPAIEKDLQKIFADKSIFVKDCTYLQVICLSAENLLERGLNTLFSLFHQQLFRSPNLLTLNF